MSDNAKVELKTTSLRIPVSWWAELKELSFLRETQGDHENHSLNDVMVEAIGDWMQRARLELTERQGRRKH